MGNNERFDFAVLGSGFAGSIMAMVLRRLGRSVLLLERGAHPRFAIGESSTPLANLLLETLAQEHDLPFLKELSEWGSWQRTHPEIVGGLKRGFSFYAHLPGQPLDFSDRSRQLLVAASPNDEVADTHWLRADFDGFLVRQAQALGVHYVDRAGPAELVRGRDDWRINGRFSAGFVIDASGPNNPLAVPERGFEAGPLARAIYAHFRNVPRLVEPLAGMPYPPDDAAVHHVFENGWIWALRFNNGVTSAGAAFRGAAQSWEDLIRPFPTLAAQFRQAERITPFHQAERLSFRRARAIGEGFALLPSAAAFVDPLLSTGFALALLGVRRLAQAIAANRSLEGYESQTLAEADAAADLVSALYAKMPVFPEFARLTLLYFAAMSYTESCWRQGRPEAASGFLLTNDPRFSAARRRICESARRGESIQEDEIFRAIEPYDIAGLSKRERRNWHPIELPGLALGAGTQNPALDKTGRKV